MATAADLIRRSLKLLGVQAAGESLRAEDQADCLTELNSLLGTWANQRLFVHGSRRSEHVLTPYLTPHTIGSGGTFNTTRPVRIDAAGIVAAGDVNEFPLQLLDDADYQNIANKIQIDKMPSALWVEWATPTAKLWLWPIPSTQATLILYSWGRITEFTASTSIALPDGYENALAHALALQVAPMYGVEPSGTLAQNAMDALAAIKRANMQPQYMQCDPAVLRRGASGAPSVLGSSTGSSGTDSGGLY